MDENALAKSKPKEDIQSHSDCLLDNLELLKRLYPNVFKKWPWLYTLLRLACIYHDLGKLYPLLQECIRKGVPYIDGIPHGLLSLAFIDYHWLKEEKGLSDEELRLLFQAVAYHHDRQMPYNNEAINKELSSLRVPYSHFAYDKLPSDFLAEKIHRKYFTINKRFDKRDGEVFYRFIMLLGLLNRLDYAASAHIPVEQPNDFLPEALAELMTGWQNSNPQIQWNDLQIYMMNNSDKNIIAIAQTGKGKTEGGLLWLGNDKGFFTLPLKSANNAIYDRITTKIVLTDRENRVGMLHSDTYIRYLEMSEKQQKRMEEIEETAAAEGITERYYTRTKQLSLPLTVCTLDQLFSFVYLYRGFEYKLATLSYSKIIIDEVQMYSADLMAYLVLGLRYITHMGGRFAILTATLPTFFVDLLREQDISFEPPRVFTDGTIRHSLKVMGKPINAEDILALSQKYKGKKILVICNTIKSAVQLYHQLKDEHKVDVLHSYFTKEDRGLKEAGIFLMGQKESDESGIWITTQIVEASLDIDFDLLFTELSDLNGLFQRMGRCYRKRVLDLLYNCFVFTGGSKRCSGVGLFIDKEVHRLSKQAIMQVDGVIGEEQKIAMVEQLYTKEKLPEYYDEIKEAINYAASHTAYDLSKKEADRKFRDIETMAVIPRKVYESHKKEIQQAIEDLQKEYDGMERERVREIRAKSRKVITNQTVDLALYLAKDLQQTEILKINDYEQIPIVECDYNSEEGIVRPVVKPMAETQDFLSHSF